MWLIVLAGILWGVTNPLLKKYTQGFSKPNDSDAESTIIGGPGTATVVAVPAGGLMADLRFLLSRPKYLAAQGTNLLGSVAFTIGMGDASLSVGPAVANGLAMAVTCAMSTLVLKEEPMAPRTAFGVGLIFVGLLLCVTAG
jgi:drug/metabolite transporter (DMT)-like permease